MHNTAESPVESALGFCVSTVLRLLLEQQQPELFKQVGFKHSTLNCWLAVQRRAAWLRQNALLSATL
jgi:hypothetical protein